MTVGDRDVVSRLVIYAEDVLLTLGASRALSDRAKFEIFAADCALCEMIPFVERVKPDVVLLHIAAEMTLNFMSILRKSAPSARLILWGSSFSEELEWQAREIGVAAFISRGISEEEFVTGVLQAANGAVTRTVARAGITRVLDSRERATTVKLTARESQLVSLLAQGLKNKEIASCLNISDGTVRIYLSKLFAKIGARDRFETAVFGLKNVYCGQASWDGKNGFVTERDEERARPFLKSLVLVEPQRRRGYARRATAAVE